ncbi:glycoside hydrolase family 5 protein [bacterium]|nr:glycoside hydrolase family 5 protein [bacterium]MBU1636013.1 glycoside hydrolase family 5 protein [bacterium]
MKSHFIVYLSICSLLIMCPSSSATDPATKDKTLTDPYEINSHMYPGINIGNALEAPNEGDWGVTIQDDYFTIIKEAGFNSVRIPIRWSTHTAVDSPYTIDAIFLNRVKHVVDSALDNDLYTVINIHHYEEIFQNPAAHKERFLSIWQQISSFFQDYPTSLIFEVLNEPHDNFTSELWNNYFPLATDTIRKTNPTRTIIIGTAGWGGISALNDLIIPEEEQNLIITIHYYEPFHFTHQDAEWVDGADAWLGTDWSATLEEVTSLKNHFDQINTWAIDNNRPIYIGEFGAYNKADMNSRYLWTGYVVNQCKQHNFSWAYWEFCSGFGAWNPETEDWHQLLLDALIQD